MRGWNIVWTLTVIAVLLFGSVFLVFGFTEEANRIAIRLSARLAGILFALAFAASSLPIIHRGKFTLWLLTNRKYIGLSFAHLHFIHLILLFLLQQSFHPVFDLAARSSLAAGGLAYFFIASMYLTSFSRFSNLLSARNWNLLHTVGGYWIWIIFFRSYVKRVDTEIEYLPLVLLFAGVLLLRIVKLMRSRRINRNAHSL